MLFAVPAISQEKPDKISFFDTYLPSFTADFQILKYCSASIGFGYIRYQERMDKSEYGIMFNNEFTFQNINNDFVYAPNILFFYNYTYFYAGAKFSYHTNFKNGGTLQFTPEIGLGAYIIFMVYGRNIPVTKNNAISVNKNNISIKLMLPLESLF
jgi:hypothetical protein